MLRGQPSQDIVHRIEILRSLQEVAALKTALRVQEAIQIRDQHRTGYEAARQQASVPDLTSVGIDKLKELRNLPPKFGLLILRTSGTILLHRQHLLLSFVHFVFCFVCGRYVMSLSLMVFLLDYTQLISHVLDAALVLLGARFEVVVTL